MNAATRGSDSRPSAFIITSSSLQLVMIFVIALALRLVVWRWREFYDLGGDEREYLSQALTILRERRYEELRLMRPPLYPLFLASCILLVDSLVQNLRLVQAVISAATVAPVYLLTKEISDWRLGIGQDGAGTHALRSTLHAPALAALLCALSYTLAANATELLTETVFLFGLTTLFWLLLRAARWTAGGGLFGTIGASGPHPRTLSRSRHEMADELVDGAVAARRERGEQVEAPALPPSSWRPLSRRFASLLSGRLGPEAQPEGPGAQPEGPGFDRRFPSLPRGANREAEEGTGGEGRRPAWLAAAAGLLLGALCLTRSVALPLLPLGALWLLLAGKNREPARQKSGWISWAAARCSLLFVLCSLLIILPWTARNYLSYGGLIVIDTTGAENLWLDNDPAGREAVKAQLYAMGDDRLGRQQLAARQGLAAILADPGRFAAKAWGELRTFFALEYADDMRARPSIWLPPAEVWARLLLGDGLWLLALLAGTYGIGRLTIDDVRFSSRANQPDQIVHRQSRIVHPLWLLAPWALYTLLTAVLFHVELRYRLPLYPVLLPYAALAPARLRMPAGMKQGFSGRERHPRPSPYALLLPACCLLLTLLHRPYPLLVWQLGWKHAELARAEAALLRGDAAAAQAAAAAALARDDRSALARVALARAALLRGDTATAEARLRAAIAAIPAHPHAHLLLGDLLRRRGDGAASAELAYEPGSLQDLQAWSWDRFSTPPPASLDIGGGRDLGFVRGFYLAEQGGWRWTRAQALVRLSRPAGPAALQLRLASGRPAGAPPPTVEVLADGRSIGRLEVRDGWSDYRLPLPASGAGGPLIVELRSDTFTPRAYDRASPDGRQLGVMAGMIGWRPAD